MKFDVPRMGRLLEGSGYLLEVLVRLGLISSSAVAAVFGQFVLAIVLASLALGISIRLWRLRSKRVQR